MSKGRFFSKEELIYQKTFNNGSYVMDMFTYKKDYIKLLKKAIKKNKALTQDDFISIYGKKNVKYLEELANI